MRTAQELAPDEVKLAELFKDYLEQHAIKLRSYKTCVILLRYWEDFYKDGTVADLKDARRQEDFREFLFKRGLAHNSVNRVLEIGRAAIRRAHKRNVLAFMPHIVTLKVEEDKPKGRPLSIEELRALYTEMADHQRLFMILMLGTGARNEAICHLEWAQVDFEAGLIHLNPSGRRQTSKRRPTVRLTPFVRAQLMKFNEREGRVLTFRGKSMNTVNQGIEKAVGRAKLKGKVTAYSFRHTVARWLRKEGVSPWETAMQLGHKVVGFSMTERYAAWSPDYLENAAAALDKLLCAAIPLDAPSIPSGR
jgi:integrase